MVKGGNSYNNVCSASAAEKETLILYSYRYGKEPAEAERMDHLKFIARVTPHIPDKGQVTVQTYNSPDICGAKTCPAN